MNSNIESKISTNIGEIYFKTIGSGTPIVFLHGGPGLFHDYLTPYFTSLKSGYQLIFFDQPGSGKSRLKNLSVPLSMDDFVEAIHHIKTHLLLDRFHLISHSFGSLLAVKYACKYPNDLLSNIMIAPAPGNDLLDKEARKNMKNRLSDSDLQEIQDIMVHSPFENENIDYINQLIMINEKTRYYDISHLKISYKAFTIEDIKKLQYVSMKLHNELDNYDIYSLSQQIKVKTLVIHGDYDTIPLSSSRLYVKNIKDSRLCVIKDCGHFPFYEKTTQTLEIIENFLIKCQSTT